MASTSFPTIATPTKLECYPESVAFSKFDVDNMSDLEFVNLKRRLKNAVPRIGRSEVAISSFVGMEEVKEDIIAGFGCDVKPLDKLLLFGPIGSGKSHLARALTTELKAVLFTIDKTTLQGWSNNLKLFTRVFAELAAEGGGDKNGRVVLLLENFDWFFETENETKAVKYMLNSVQSCWAENSCSTLFIIGCSSKPWALNKLVIDSFQKKAYLRPLNFLERKQLIQKKACENLRQPGLNMTDWELGEMAKRVYRFASWEICECVEKAFKLQCPPHIKRNVNLRPLTKVDFEVTLDRMSGGSGWDVLKRKHEEFNRTYGDVRETTGSGAVTFEEKGIQVEVNRNNKAWNILSRFFDHVPQ